MMAIFGSIPFIQTPLFFKESFVTIIAKDLDRVKYDISISKYRTYNRQRLAGD